MIDYCDLFAKLKQASPDFLKNYCVINGNIRPLEQVEKMGLEEYTARTIFSLPLRFYKYYPDVKKDGTNYSILALESNEVYLRVCFQRHKSEREAKKYAVRYIKPKGKRGVGVE